MDVDPLNLYENTKLKLIIERHGLTAPNIQGKNENQIKNLYIEVSGDLRHSEKIFSLFSLNF